MKRLRWAFCVALPLALLSMATLSSCQERASSFAVAEDGQNGIIGGKLVASDDPIQKVIVRILMVNPKGVYSACTGTIISPRHILTAAHCFQRDKIGRLEPDRLYLGVGVEASPQNVFIHPSYNDRKDWNRYDVAILEFASGNVVETAILPEPGEESVVAGGYFVAGYGRTSPETPVVNAQLYKLESSSTIPEISDSEMVVYSSDTTGTCYGDSGGPFYSVTDGKVKVYSLLSRPSPLSEECLGSDIQTRVEPILGWIRQVIAGEISPRLSIQK